MIKYVFLFLLFCLVSCEKEEELSKARVLWGNWNVVETKVIFDNLNGVRLSTTDSNFEISFFYTNKGHITGINNEDFIWAVQDDPNVLIISPELFSVDSMGNLQFNTTDLFYIGEFSNDKVSLHNEFTSIIDSIFSTTERNWILTPK